MSNKIIKVLLFVLFVTTPWVASMAGISITCSPAEGGTVVKLSNGDYQAIPNEGYTFSNWYVDFGADDATETANPCDFDDYLLIAGMYGGGSVYVTANFKKQSTTKYSITVKSANSSMGSVTGGGTYAYGSTQTIQAIPNECHKFKQWSDGNTDNPRTVTVISNATYTAEFIEEGCDCGWMTLPELQTAVGYKIGSKGQTILNSAKKNYVFKKMRITYSSTSTMANSFITIKYPDSGTSAFEFTFYKDYQYRINGTGSFYKYLNNKGTHISGNTYEYDLNMICKTSGKYFYVEMWQENFIPSQVQICVEKICTITTSATNGTVTGGGEYNINSKATLTATPNECYRFSKWSDGNTDNPRIVTVNGDATYTAEFIEEGCIDPTWQILYTSTDGNVVTPYVSNFGANIVSNEYKDGQGIITLDGPATRIGYNAFKNCSSLKSITIPNSVTTLDMYAFDGCTSLTSITIPEGVISIGEMAFVGCSSLANITLPESLTSIGQWAFNSCTSLTAISIPEGITQIEQNTFNGCSALANITLHDGITNIGEGAFANCTSLATFTIPAGITTIEKSTFAGCKSLSTITIHEGITSIGNNAFATCSGMTYITCKPTTPPTCGNNAFWNMDNTIPVYVPCGCVDAYKAATNWKYFKNFQSKDCCDWMTLPELQTAVGYKLVDSDGTRIQLNSAKKNYIFKKMRVTYSSKSTLLNSYIRINHFDNGQIALEFTFGDYYKYRINGTGSFYNYLNNKGTHVSGNTYEYDLNTICDTNGKYFYIESWQENFIPSQVQICVEQLFSITTSATNGTVTGGGEYNINAKATLTATPNECYRFSKWSDGNTDNPRIVTVNGDATYTAEFVADQFTITVQSDNNSQGTVSVEKNL